MANYYLDYLNGADATTDTPLGWWSVSVTPVLGSAPAAGETATGSISGSTAILTVAPGSWVGAITCYFYGKSAAFQAETLTFTGGATGTIAGDFTYCAWKTITSGATAARIAPGDVVRIAKSPDPTSMSQNATWTDNSSSVTLTTAVTANIDDGQTAWTASENVTCTADDTIYTEGAKSSKIAIAAGFTTGLAAYKALAGATDYSGYQQVSFAIRSSVTIGTAGYIQICLCSDNAGATPVDTINVPIIGVNNSWNYTTVNTGAALGNSIQSVALYTTNDFGAANIWVDNIIACKASSSADSLTLNSLISKNSLATGGNEPWLPIRSINGTTIKIATYGSFVTPANDRPYSGTTETVTIYKRQLTTLATPHSSLNDVQEDGASGSPTTYSGGWNTATNSQDGETFYDGVNGSGTGIINLNTKNYITLDRLNPVRGGYGIYSGALTSTSMCIGCNITGHSFTANARALYIEGRDYTINVTNCCHNGTYGTDFLTEGNPRPNNITATFVNLNSNGASGISLHDVNNLTLTATNVNRNGTSGIEVDPGGANNRFFITNMKNNAAYGVKVSEMEHPHFLYNTAFSGNATSAFYYLRQSARISVKSGSIAEATKITFFRPFLPTGVYMTAYGGDTNDNRIYLEYGNIVSQTTTRHTASGVAWQMSPTDSLRSSIYPLELSLAKIAVSANNLVTVSAWCKLSHATDIGAKLICKGGQLTGVASDVTDTKTADTDWEELTLTFTPTEAGVIEILGYGYWVANAATQSVYWDDVSITQA